MDVEICAVKIYILQGSIPFRAAFMKDYQEAIKGDVVPAVPLLSALHSEFF